MLNLKTPEDIIDEYTLLLIEGGILWHNLLKVYTDYIM
jgi:hypothetical protein